jgi:hypothetical protein
MTRFAGRPRGIESVPTMKTRDRRSIPRHQSDDYLDLYILHKEKQRLEQELLLAGERRRRAGKRLSLVEARMEKLRKSTIEGPSTTHGTAGVGGRKTPKRNLKVMRVGY